MFQVIGNLVSESGFEDNVFQASVCLSGSINGIMTRSHYNRAWFVHNIMSEALKSYYRLGFCARLALKFTLFE